MGVLLVEENGDHQKEEGERECSMIERRRCEAKGIETKERGSKERRARRARDEDDDDEEGDVKSVKERLKGERR